MKETKFRRVCVIFWTHLSWFIAYIPIRTYLYTKTTYPRDEDILKHPLLIIANHKWLFDPWIIGLNLPYRHYGKMAPIRFLATQYFNNSFLNFIYRFIVYPFFYWPNGVLLLPPRSAGGTPTIEDKTKSIIDAINKKEVVLMFPEGGVKREDRVYEFKRGAVYIQKKTGVPILCVSIRYDGNKFLPWPFTKRYINWGKEMLFIHPEVSEDERTSSEWLHQKVSSLYENT